MEAGQADARKLKRCKDCPRPICQRIITLTGCRQRKLEEIEGEPLNPCQMHDLYCGC